MPPEASGEEVSRVDYSDYFVKVDGKDIMTSRAVWEQMTALSCQVDRARMQARIAMALAALSVGVTIALALL